MNTTQPMLHALSTSILDSIQELVEFARQDLSVSVVQLFLKSVNLEPIMMLEGRANASLVHLDITV